MTLILFQRYLFAGYEYNASLLDTFENFKEKKKQMLLISTELAVTLRLAQFQKLYGRYDHLDFIIK